MYDINRHVSVHSLLGTVNVSLKLLIAYADEISLTDKALSEMILIFLKHHREELYYTVSPKKENLGLMMEMISLDCSNTREMGLVKQELAKIKRTSIENFSTAITRYLLLLFSSKKKKHTVIS